MNRRVLIVALVCIVVLAAAAVGVWVWLSRGGPRPELEVVAPEAHVKIGTKVVATVHKGDRLPIYARRTGWYQVRAKGVLGWIHAAHIRRVPPPDAAPKLVEAEILGVHFPDVILGEFPRTGERWVLVEVQARAAKANAVGGTAIDTRRFVLLHRKSRFFHPRLWKSIPVGDHTVDRLELGEEFTLPVGQTRKLRLAYTAPSDLVARVGWHIVYVPLRPKGAAPPPGSADAVH
jgi:hypothetical protein